MGPLRTRLAVAVAFLAAGAAACTSRQATDPTDAADPQGADLVDGASLQDAGSGTGGDVAPEGAGDAVPDAGPPDRPPAETPCRDAYLCVNACPKGPERQSCAQQCGEGLSQEDEDLANDFLACASQCFGATLQEVCVLTKCWDLYHTCVIGGSGHGDCGSALACIDGCGGDADCQLDCLSVIEKDEAKDALDVDICVANECGEKPSPQCRFESKEGTCAPVISECTGGP